MGGGQFTKIDPVVAKRTGAYYTYRASRQIRLLVSRPGKRWELVDIVRRGDKSFYKLGKEW